MARPIRETPWRREFWEETKQVWGNPKGVGTLTFLAFAAVWGLFWLLVPGSPPPPP